MASRLGHAQFSKKMAKIGTSCPDHFIRTKKTPIVLNVKIENKNDNQIIKDIDLVIYQGFSENNLSPLDLNSHIQKSYNLPYATKTFI